MSNLNEEICAVEYDDLIAGVFPAAEVFSVELAAVTEEATLKRGTVLARNSDGEMIVLGSDSATDSTDTEDSETEGTETEGTETEGTESESTDSTATANCILADDVVVGTEAVNAVAYRAGHFNRNKLIVADGYTLTEDDEEELRKAGILLSDAVVLS